MQNIFKGSK